MQRRALFPLLLTLLLAACADPNTQYHQVTISTPGGQTTANVGEYTASPIGPDGKPLPGRPFHMVPRTISTPAGFQTVYTREYE